MKRLLLLVLALSFSLVLLTLTYPAAGQGESKPFVSMKREITINEYGYVRINDTASIANPSLNPIPLRGFEMTYPSTHLGYSLQSIEPAFNMTQEVLALKKSVETNLTRIIVSANVPLEIQPQQNVTVKLQLYLGGLVQVGEGSTYRFLAPLLPSANITIDTATSTLTLPLNMRLAEAPTGFVKSEVSGMEVWKASPRLIPPDKSTTKDYDLHLVVDDPSFTVLRFTDSSREVLVSSSDVFVKEYFRLANEGRGNISSLRLNLLNKNVTRLEVLPIREPPLSNINQITISDGLISLEELFKRRLEGGERLALAVQYPLPNHYLAKTDNTLQLTVPVTPVFDALIEDFTVRITPTFKHHILSGMTEARLVDVSPLTPDILILSLRPSFAFATDSVMPVASTIFVITLVFTLLSKGVFRMEVEKKALKAVDEFVRVFDDKIALTRELLNSLKDRGVGRVSRKELEDVRKELEEIKSRSAARIGEFKPTLLASRPDLQEKISEISNIEREFDRAALNLFHIHRQHLTGRIRKDAFDRQESDHLKRLNRFVESLSDRLNTIRREFEE